MTSQGGVGSSPLRRAKLFSSGTKSPNLKEDTMNPLDSIPGTITAGFVLTVVLYFVVKMLV